MDREFVFNSNSSNNSNSVIYNGMNSITNISMEKLLEVKADFVRPPTPTVASPVPAVRDEMKADSHGVGARHSQSSHSHSQYHVQQQHQEQRTQAPMPSILIAEDNEFNQLIIKRLLEKLGLTRLKIVGMCFFFTCPFSLVQSSL